MPKTASVPRKALITVIGILLAVSWATGSEAQRDKAISFINANCQTAAGTPSDQVCLACVCSLTAFCTGVTPYTIPANTACLQNILTLPNPSGATAGMPRCVANFMVNNKTDADMVAQCNTWLAQNGVTASQQPSSGSPSTTPGPGNAGGMANLELKMLSWALGVAVLLAAILG